MSNINNSTINENFPVAGQDNDTQVFRDNFDSIKRNLGYASEEITDLQNRTGGLAATEILNGTAIIGSDFNNRLVTNAIFQNNRSYLIDLVAQAGIYTTTAEIDASGANYYIVKFGGNTSMSFTNFPTASSNPRGFSKVMVEIYGDGTLREITLEVANGLVYKKINWDPSWAANKFKVTSPSNPLIFEVWSHTNNLIFIRNLGLFT